MFSQEKCSFSELSVSKKNVQFVTVDSSRLFLLPIIGDKLKFAPNYNEYGLTLILISTYYSKKIN